MKSIFLLVTFLGIGLAASAQTLIQGTVSDSQGEPLFGANIYLKNTYDGISSEVDGSFRFETDEQGSQLLVIDYMGYESQFREVELNGKPIQSSFILKEAFNQLTAVVITAGSFEAGDKARSIELTPMDIATTAGAMGDIVAAINTLPGTTPVGESGRLYVRGGSDAETRTFIDGLLVSQPYYSNAPNLSTRGRFNPFLFSGTTFNTGGYSAEFGQALSSVLLLNTNNAKPQDELNISLLPGLGGDVAGTKSWKNGSATLTANYFNMKPYLALVEQNQEWPKPGELYSLETNVKQETGKNGLFKIYSNYNSGRFAMLQNDLDNPGEQIKYGQKSDYFFFNSSWTNAFSEKWLFYSGVSFTTNTEETKINQLPISETQNASHLKAGVDYQAAEKISIRFGSDYFLDQYSFASSLDTLKIDRKLNNNLMAGYGEANIYASNKLVFRAGGRYEYSEILKKSSLSPRLSSAFKFTDHSQLSFAWGWFYQTPQNRDLIYTQNLDFERADHYLLNYQTEVNKRLFRAEAFYKDYSSLIKYDGNEYIGKSNLSNDGHGYAYGVDLFFRDNKSIKNGQYWISYSYLETERDYLNYPISATPDFASKHNFSFVYKHFSNQLRSMISGDFSYSSPRCYNNPNSEKFNSERMKSYQSLNFSWAYLFRQQIIFYFAMNNVLGRSQEYGRRYASLPDDNGYYASEVIKPFSNRFYVLGVFFTFSKDKTKNQLDKIN